MNKVNLVYFSPTETTKKTVKGIAKDLAMKVNEFDLLLPSDREHQLCFNNDELLIIGAPVYAGRIPRLMQEFLTNKVSGSLYAVIVAVYGHRAYDNALAEMKSILSNKGIKIIAAGAFLGEHSYSKDIARGRPDELDLEKQLAFGKAIKEKINKGDFSEVDVPGEIPQGVASISPYRTITNENCVLCGLCAKYCPVQAIPIDNPSLPASKDCIMCCKCVKNCPTEARVHNIKKIEEFVDSLKARVGNIRMEPEIYI